MTQLAHLKEESPWYPLFENGQAPIKSVAPSLGDMIGGGGVQMFYDLDLDRCSEFQKERIFFLVAGQCGTSVEEARRGVQQQGFLPLRAIHVSAVSTDLRAFL